MNICFVTDPLVTTAGAVRPALLLAKEFSKKCWNATIVTTRCNESIREWLLKENIIVKKVGPELSLIRSFPTLDAWIRSLIRPKVVHESCNWDIVINTSSCIVTQAHAYYAQGLMTKALRDIYAEIPISLRYSYQLLKGYTNFLEKRLVRRFRKVSKLFIANSEYCASMYRELNTKVDNVISPPLDCSFFRPTTNNPSADYVLTHLGTYGKEGKAMIVMKIADLGVRIKVFGATHSIPKELAKHENIEFLGMVSDSCLVDLYTNASFLLFAFTHEPFGYVPVESMACGTPVLTYRRQGPSETVVDEQTGWLADNDARIVALALDLWNNKYDTRLRENCRKRALIFDTGQIYEKWTTALYDLVNEE